MFRAVNDPQGPVVSLVIDDRPVSVPAGLSVAAAVLRTGGLVTRETAVSGRPRAPYCMMGVCFDCLMEIDGEANQQACMTTVRDGMRVARQRGAPMLDTSE
jgi:predicted molibdopterin-dependent oxidoreductase YjgC